MQIQILLGKVMHFDEWRLALLHRFDRLDIRADYLTFVSSRSQPYLSASILLLVASKFHKTYMGFDSHSH